MSRRSLSRRAFTSGAITGGLSGVLVTTGVHAVGHHVSVDSADHSAMGAVGHADVGFCTDMTAHHLQAIVMCERVLGSETGDSVQAAATEVLRNQAIEIGMMRAWLTDWGASTATPTTVMGWMADFSTAESTTMDMSAEHDTDGIPLADMPGYATNAELLALATAPPGIEKGRLWLELMRSHHVGGVAMATAASELAAEEKVVRLALTQAETQSWEIAQYDILLETIYA